MPSVSLTAAEAPLVLALDLGTSSFRALCYDAQARVVEGSEEQLAHAAMVTPDGGVEADAADLFDLLVLCIDGAVHRLGRRAADLVAVGSSCFWHSLMGVGPDGEPVTPLLLWADTRSGRFVSELKQELDPAAVQQHTGCILHSSYWPAKLRWLRAASPDAFQRSSQFLSFAEYAARRLQDDARVSLSMASGTGLLSVRSGAWDETMLDHLGIDSGRLPELTDVDQPQKQLVKTYAERWPALTGIPWYPAAGDGACANVGSGAVHPNTFALTLGTSGALRLVRDDASVESPAGIWTYRLDRDHAVVGGSLSNGGNLLAWLGDLFDVEFDAAAMDDAGKLAPDAHGLTLLPFIAGERAPGWNDEVTGVIAGLKLGTKPKHVIRAAMESVAFRFARVYDQLRPLASAEHRIVANGGAILRSPAWIQIVADTLGHDVRTLPAEAEVSGRGAAIIALVGTDYLPAYDAAPDPSHDQPVYRSNRENHARYRTAVERQRHLESRLFPDGDTWDR